MKLIVAVDKNWGIGTGNDLLFHIPEDMKFFRRTTLGKVVVMGRKTLESFPNAKPLKDRTNIVMTRDTDYTCDGAQVCHSTKGLFELLHSYNTDDVFVIGGGQIYKELLPYCDTAMITKIDDERPSEVVFPNVDVMTEWVLAEETAPQNHEGILYRFCTYKRDK